MFGKSVKWKVGEFPASTEFQDLAEGSWFVFVNLAGDAVFQSLNPDRPMGVLALLGSTVEYKNGKWIFDGDIVPTD